jgi:uncharacterized phiE125 gp8 family phage protein
VTPTVVVPPDIEPVSWAEAQSWTKALDDEQSDVELLISAARELCEHRKGYAFYAQTLEYVLHSWASACNWPVRHGSRLLLPRATPLVEVESVTYVDENGEERTVDSADYRLDTRSIPGAIVFVDGFSWPSLDTYAPNPVVIRYIAGRQVTSPPTPVSASIRLAMRLLIAHWYKNREAVLAGLTAGVSAAPLPEGVDALLAHDQQIFAF